MKTRFLLLTLLLGQAWAQIGQPADSLLGQLSAHKVIKTILGYSTINNFSFKLEERSGVLYALTGEGILDESNIAFSGDLIGAASGYGEGLANPVKDFFSNRIGELSGQGEVNLGVEQYTLMVDVSSDAAPYQLRFRLSLAELPSDLFPVAKHSLGPADAKYIIREFSDFQCPFCARFVSGAFLQIKEQLLSRGDVRFEFHHFPLITIHPNAFPAAEAAECITAANTPEAFWAYHDALFERQQAWQGLGEPNDYFIRLAQDIGLKTEGVESCLNERTFAVEIDDAYQTAGNTLQIGGTPTLFVNGYRVTNYGDIDLYLTLMDFVDKFSSAE
jgi:protein-disulfide isomerase